VIGEMVVEPQRQFGRRVHHQRQAHLYKGWLDVTRSGKAFVYTGYSWRGRTTIASGVVLLHPATRAEIPQELREVMWVSPDQSTMEGRWFWGAYQEFGYDVKLHRAGEGPTVMSVDRTMLKTGSTAQRVKIYGDNFFASAVGDIDLGTASR
jgi:quinohemoprotein amine dehydrogenase